MSGGEQILVRVLVTEVWDAVELSLTRAHTVRQLKQEGLARATGRALDPSDFQVKYRGALVLDEDRTLEDLGVPNGAPMIILPARRQPVR